MLHFGTYWYCQSSKQHLNNICHKSTTSFDFGWTLVADGKYESNQKSETINNGGSSECQYNGCTVHVAREMCVVHSSLPTKQVSKNNYDPPHTVIFKLFEPPLRVLLRAATKLVNNVIAICPNTGRICLRLMIDKIVLKNLKTERAHDHGAAWHTIEHDHTSPSRVQLVWPTEHIGNWMDKRRDKDSVLKSITTSLKIFEEGSFFIDQPSLIGLVSDLTTLSVNKRLFDGLTMTEVARKRKGNETLSTFESIELDRMVKRGKLI